MTPFSPQLAPSQQTQVDAWLQKNGKTLNSLTTNDVTRLGRSVGLDASGRAEVRRMIEAAKESGIDTVERLATQHQASAGPASGRPGALDASRLTEEARTALRALLARTSGVPAAAPPAPAPPPAGPSTEEAAKTARIKALKASPLFRAADNLAQHWTALPVEDRMLLLEHLVNYPSLKLPGSKVTESPIITYDPKAKTPEQKAARLVLEAFPELETNDYHHIGPLQTQVEGLYDERGGLLGAFVMMRQPVTYAEDGPARTFKTEAAARKAGVDVNFDFYVESYRLLAYVDFKSGTVQDYTGDGTWHWDH
jgi:hypothetical protein